MRAAYELYEVKAELKHALEIARDQAEENGGLIPDSLAEWIDDLEMEREQLIGDLARSVKNYQAEIDALKAEEARLKARRLIAEKCANSIKDAIENVLGVGNKYTDGVIKLSWRKSEKCIISDDGSIPNDFIKIKREPDVAKIKSAIKSGSVFNGAFVIECQNLQIK